MSDEARRGEPSWEAMTAERRARQQRLRELLRAAERPIPGGELASRLGVSRQAVVQDVAVLRAAGEPIVATARGYLLAPAVADGTCEAVVQVRHRPEEAGRELLALVDAGARVVDVVVEHPLYGELRGMLLLASRADVCEWLQRAEQTRAHMLSELTDGCHLHTLQARGPEVLERAQAALRALGFLVEGAWR
jgi:transcriptional regulator of NAD metabolism